MTEYIERETAIKAAEHAYNEWNLAMATADGKREINLVYKRQELCKAVASVFDSAPATDVAPVVHGEWIPISDGDGAECGECGGYLNVSENGGMAAFRQFRKFYAFCPMCGARMDADAVERQVKRHG